MKTSTFTRKKIMKTFGILGLIMMLSVSFNTVEAQDGLRTVSGIIADETGPLENAAVVLKGTAFSTTTNEKGEFTFPKPLKENDVLIVMQLGYKELEVVIEADTTFLNIVLSDYEIIIIGALKMSDSKAGNK